MRFDLPSDRYRFIALDVETANGAPWSISQVGIACVTMDNQVETRATLVDPRCGFDSFNIRLTGIRPEHVRGAPRFGEVLAMLDPLLRGHVIFQHSSFDSRAFAAACDRDGLEMPGWEWMDSVKVARRAWPEFSGQGGHGLAHLKERLGLEFNHHDAGEDARAAAEVVLRAEARMGVDFRMIHATAKARKRKPPAPPPNPEGALFGTVVVFSGELSLPRPEAMSRAARMGMKVSERLTRSTTHLVLGGPRLPLIEDRRPSAKEKRAAEMQAAGHPLQVIDEAAFLSLLSQ